MGIVPESQEPRGQVVALADYCASDSERAKNPEAYEHLAAISKGDAHALKFMRVLWNFEHVYDDLVDGAKVSTETAAKWLTHLLEEVTFNPFYLAHAKTLLPFIVSAADRWVAGDELPAPERDFVKCGDVDLYLIVAYLVGGWDHMRAMKSARTYDRG